MAISGFRRIMCTLHLVVFKKIKTRNELRVIDHQYADLEYLSSQFLGAFEEKKIIFKFTIISLLFVLFRLINNEEGNQKNEIL